MTALYDRRRVNGPEEAFLPLFNVKTSEKNTDHAPVWAQDETRLLVDPMTSIADSLEKTTMIIGEDKLVIPRIARRDFSSRGDQRGEYESRPMCKC